MMEMAGKIESSRLRARKGPCIYKGECGVITDNSLGFGWALALVGWAVPCKRSHL